MVDTSIMFETNTAPAAVIAKINSVEITTATPRFF